MAKNIVEFKNTDLVIDEKKILNNINIKIEEGKFYTLLGPSGSGKSTLLSLISGKNKPTNGEVLIDGKVVNGIPVNKRNVNTVFQNYALFPNLNVYENIAFGPRLKHKSEKEIEKIVDEMLSIVKLSDVKNRNINELSGGQQQRIAIARALANEPKVLLLDEPLSALDYRLRKEMQVELKNIQQKLGLTFIFVTHDQEEALAMSDSIFVINDGKLMQSGTPEDIYDEPINNFVANFIGEANIVNGIMKEDYLVSFAGKDFKNVDAGMKTNERVQVVIRPEDLDIVEPDKGKIQVTIDDQLFRGDFYEIKAHDTSGNEWAIQATNPTEIGSLKGIYFDPFDIHIMRLNEKEKDFDKRLENYD